MRAGELDRLITLRRKARSIDDAGTVTETWTDLATIRAALLPPAPVNAAAAPTTLASAERDESFGFQDVEILTFRVRWRDYQLTGSDRVTYSGGAYQVVGVTEIGRRVGLDIRCRRIT
jgi:head-tail adaptor